MTSNRSIHATGLILAKSFDEGIDLSGVGLKHGDEVGGGFKVGLAPPGRAPAFADTDLLVNAKNGHRGALAEVRGGTTYVTPNQFNEFVAGGSGRRGFLKDEGIQSFSGQRAGDVASGSAFQKTFGSVVDAQSRGDAALVAFARQTGHEAITMDRRLYNFVTQTLRDESIPIRRVPR